MDDEGLLNKAAGFERFCGYVFKDQRLLLDALISKGLPNERPDLAIGLRQSVLSNMGDAVIHLLATEHLIRFRRIEDVGDITEMRKTMVNRSALNQVSRPILQFLSMTSGERDALLDSSIAGEYLEAVVGALYLDGGLVAARQLLVLLDFFEQGHE